MNQCICLKICANKATNQDQDRDREDSTSGCNDCSICLESLQLDAGSNNDEIIKLKCGHSYHQQCIKDWRSGSMESSKRCPLCRASFAENEIIPDSKAAPQHQVIFISDTFMCMVQIIIRILTALMVVAVNAIWIILLLNNMGPWIIAIAVATPGTILYRAYWVKDERDICCYECTKGQLLFFSFVFLASPLAVYVYMFIGLVW